MKRNAQKIKKSPFYKATSGKPQREIPEERGQGAPSIEAIFVTFIFSLSLARVLGPLASAVRLTSHSDNDMC